MKTYINRLIFSNPTQMRFIPAFVLSVVITAAGFCAMVLFLYSVGYPGFEF